MKCDTITCVLAGDALPEEIGGEAALRAHALQCGGCREAILLFLAEERLLRARFAPARPATGPAATNPIAIAWRVRLAAAAAVLAAAFGALRLWPEAPARVVTVRGPAFVDGRAVEPGRAVPHGRTVTTGPGGTLALALGGASVVTLWPETALRIGPDRAAIALTAGAARCRIAPGGGTFRVATPCGEVTAMGTEFDVRLAPPRRAADPQETVMTEAGGMVSVAILTVTVIAGWIEFRGAGAPAAVHAREQLVAAQGGAPRITKLTEAGELVVVPALGGSGVRHIQPAVSGLALAPDGKRIAICVRQLGGGDLTAGSPQFVGVNVWNVAERKLDAFVPLDGSPSDVMFGADGTLWATEAMNNDLRRLDPTARKIAATIGLNASPDTLFTSDSARLHPSPDGKRVVVTGFNNRKAVYSYPDWKLVTVLEGPASSLPTEGAWSADGSAFVGATRGNRLRVWKLSAAGTTSRAAVTSTDAGEGIAPVFGPDGRVWALTTDAKAFGPAAENGAGRRRFACDGEGWTVAAFSRDGKRLACGALDGSVQVFHVASGQRLDTIAWQSPPDVTPSVESLLWAPDGSWLAIGRSDGSSCLVRVPAR